MIENKINDTIRNDAFRSNVKRYLNNVPYLKLENYIMTELAMCLTENNEKCAREKAIGDSRRCDLVLDENYNIEAKYHFEGDVKIISDALGKIERTMTAWQQEENLKKSWRGPTREYMSEILEQKSNYFLWMICIRKFGEENIKYKNITDAFYSNIEKSLDSAKKEIETLIQNIVTITNGVREIIRVGDHEIEMDNAILKLHLFKLGKLENMK